MNPQPIIVSGSCMECGGKVRGSDHEHGCPAMGDPPSTNFSDVGDFHEKFGLHRSDYEPGLQKVTEDLLKFRFKFMEEELEEFEIGKGADDHAQMFDALLDLVYVAMGTAHLLGYPWQAGWEAVQAANMAKVRAAADGSDSKRGSSYDVVKPLGWLPPDILAILERHATDDNPSSMNQRLPVDTCKVCGSDLDSLDTKCTAEICKGIE